MHCNIRRMTADFIGEISTDAMRETHGVRCSKDLPLVRMPRMPPSPATPDMAGRLEKLRQELKRLTLAGFIVPRADEHLGEYVPPSAERLAWLTGFTGSAGLAVVLAGKGGVFTGGRH